jgi:hypothetical protein
VTVDSYRFLPRSFRPFYEGRGPLPGEEGPVWARFARPLAESRIALLSSAGIYVRDAQPPFDLEREQEQPEWGDPTWRAIPASTPREHLGVAHLHINADDLLADPEIALPMRLLGELADQGVIGGAVEQHVTVMGYQHRHLHDWHRTTVPEIAAHLRGQAADGVVLAPA